MQLLLKSRNVDNHKPHLLSLDFLTYYQREIIKGPIVDIDNKFNKVFPVFDLFNKEFSPSSYTIDIFPSHFSFYLFKKSSNDNIKAHSHQLNNIIFNMLSSCDVTLVISDIGIKNNIATCYNLKLRVL